MGILFATQKIWHSLRWALTFPHQVQPATLSRGLRANTREVAAGGLLALAAVQGRGEGRPSSLILPPPLFPVCQRPRGSWTWRALGGLRSLNSGLPRGSASEWMVYQAPKVRVSEGHLQQGGMGQEATAVPKTPAQKSVSDCFLSQGFWSILTLDSVQ